MVLPELAPRRPRSIGRVGEDLETVGLTDHELDADRAVGMHSPA